ncbi:uncharacterized protein PHACADRAFT_86217, partial [Phanerochaete carnosa HHB-10118-sp]
EIQAYLDSHNSIRSQHGASPLTWSDDLASSALSWAEGCQFTHSDGALGPFGENLAAGTGSFTTSAAVDAATTVDPANPTFTHFTQMVWKATTQVGCGVASCNNIFDSKFGPATYHVCLYNPVGNVIGQEQ